MKPRDLGILIVDKPTGPTSHAVVNAVRRGTGVRKVGHAGTLDPRASGVLVLCLGAATRLSEYLSSGSKRYEALVRFGKTTDTFDADGTVTSESKRVPTLAEVQTLLSSFTGTFQQVPPAYSAIKLKGKKAYELARAGEDPELEARTVTIYAMELQKFEPPDLVLTIECSAGTYIRSLANDLGVEAGTGAHLAGLRRTQAGPFKLEDAVAFSILEKGFESGAWREHLLAPRDALPDFPLVKLTDAEVQLVKNGRRVPATKEAQGLARGVSPDGEMVAVLEAVEGEMQWHPRKVLVS